jgi:hypothetical protein
VLNPDLCIERIVVNYLVLLINWRCLVENLLSWRSSIECLIRSIMVVVVSEPSQPAPCAGRTPSPERVKAVDSPHHGLEPLLDEIPFGVIESAREVKAS